MKDFSIAHTLSSHCEVDSLAASTEGLDVSTEKEEEERNSGAFSGVCVKFDIMFSSRKCIDATTEDAGSGEIDSTTSIDSVGA